MVETLWKNSEVAGERKKNFNQEMKEAWWPKKWIEKKMEEKKYDEVAKNLDKVVKYGMMPMAYMVDKVLIPLLKAEKNRWMRALDNLMSKGMVRWEVLVDLFEKTTWTIRTDVVKQLFSYIYRGKINPNILQMHGNIILGELKKAGKYPRALELADKLHDRRTVENVINNMPDNMVSDDRCKIWVIKMILRNWINVTQGLRVREIIKKMVEDTQKKLEKNRIQRESTEKLAKAYSEINNRFPNAKIDNIDKVIEDLKNKSKREIASIEASIDKAYEE